MSCHQTRVDMKLYGMACDEISFQTRPVADDSLNPIWYDEQQFTMHIAYPEMALLRFAVVNSSYDRPDWSFVGLAVFPVDSCRTGYRNVQLRDERSELLKPMCALLVKIERTPCTCSAVGADGNAERHMRRMSELRRQRMGSLNNYLSANSADIVDLSRTMHATDDYTHDVICS